MANLVQMGLYELVWNRPPVPVDALLASLASPHTRRSYQKALKRFLGCIERDPWLVRPAAMADYRALLLLAYAPAVAAVHLLAVRQLYDQAIAHGLIGDNPAAATPPIVHTADGGTAVPSREVAAERLAHCRRHTEAGRRAFALCTLVGQTVLDADEIRSLQVGDYREENGSPVILLRRGEGRQPVHLPVAPDVGAALDGYLAGRTVADSSPLFSAFPVPDPADALS